MAVLSASGCAMRTPIPVVSQGFRVTQRDIYESYVDHGAPEKDLDLLLIETDDARSRQVDPLVCELVRGEFLHVAFASAAGPRTGRPTSKAFEMLARWPASPAQDTLDELIATLDTEIERTADPEKRTRLGQVRDGLGAAQIWRLPS